jgi:hypothetical protein
MNTLLLMVGDLTILKAELKQSVIIGNDLYFIIQRAFDPLFSWFCSGLASDLLAEGEARESSCKKKRKFSPHQKLNLMISTMK